VGKTIVDVVHDLDRSGRLRDALSLPDDELLERFVSQRDETAFEAMLSRHGPLVFDVCRKLLYDTHDAEDAFQATFLILARKASTVVPRALLGHWLYGVAYRVAARARMIAARRRARLQPADLAAVPDSVRSAEADLAALVHEEVGRLPDKYRSPVVLCYLEGRTNEEAANLLHWPVGTVKTRLTRARELLHSRLARHGVALSAGLVAVNTASALPAGLVEVTAKAGLCFAAGNAAAGGLASAQAVALTKGALRTMFLTKLKTVAVLVLVLALLGGIGGGVYHALAAESPRADEKDKKADKEDKDAILGTWKVVSVEVEGKEPDDEVGKALKDATLVITKDKIVWKIGDAEREATYKLDPTTKPKAIDTFQDGHVNEGIYALDGDTLKVCGPCNVEGKGRPTELATKEGSGTMLLVLKREAREKPKEK
jgi:RNA polymerase sigma factor (sigma-70 family)